MPKMNKTTLSPKTASCLSPVCAWCARGGEEERRWGSGTVISLPRRAVLGDHRLAKNFTSSDISSYCTAGDRDGFASQLIKAQLLSWAEQRVSWGTILPAGPAAPAALKENAASLKGHFSYLQPVDDLEVLKPESWWTLSFYLGRAADNALNHLKAGSLFKTCLRALPP